MPDDNFLVWLSEQFVNVISPLIDQLNTPDGISQLFADYGWDVTVSSIDATGIQKLFGIDNVFMTNLESLLAQTDQTDTTSLLETYGSIISQLVIIYTSIQDLPNSGPISGLNLPLKTKDDWSSFSQNLLQGLIIGYMEIYQLLVTGILALLGIITLENVNPGSISGRIPFIQKLFHLDRLSKVITNPTGLYTTGSTTDFDQLFSAIQSFCQVIGISADLIAPSPNLLAAYFGSGSTFSSKALRVPLGSGINSDNSEFIISLVLLPVPPKSAPTAQPTGLLITTEVIGNISAPFSIPPLTLTISGGFESDGTIIIYYQPGKITLLPGNIAGDTIAAQASLEFAPDKPGFMIGNQDSTYLQISGATFTIGAHGSINDLEMIINLLINDAYLVIDLSDADSFIHSLIDNLSIDLKEIGIRWSSKTGLTFKGSGSLELEIGVHESLGPFYIDTFSIKISGSTSGLGLIAAISGKVELGPITAAVDKIGIQLTVKSSMSDTQQDPAKSLPVSINFKPPNGLGLAIDAEIAKGGGYIFFDTDKGEYAGILEVTIGLPMEEVQVKIIGLLDTKMPDGSDGFSFLLIVTVEFPAIQLGFGFTLNGLGGLAGINRTMSIDALRAGVKNHTLNDIMFPEDPIIPKAPQIISEVSSIFPIAKDRYVFAPMIKLGWEDIITAEIGVVLEIPDPVRIALLGIIKVVLPPDADTEIVVINMDILGILDLEKKTFSLDGTLYDSRIVIFSLSGDMALRLGWGDDPTFLLSVGGFNPHFQPPPDLRTLNRLTISVSYEKVNLSLDTYLAVTSNTLQFGAHLQLTASIGPADIYGYLGFDVLIILSPFSFIADMKTMITVKVWGVTLMGIDLELTLTGPTPWHGYGKAKFDILLATITVYVDITVGDPAESQPLTPVQVLPKLIAALQSSRNWTGSMPGDSERAVTFASLPTDDKIILVHPLSNLAFHQKEIPLALTMDQFGGGKPADANFFDIVDVKIDSNALDENQPTYDYFAMGQFQTMSDADKLAAPSFVKKKSGMTIATTSVGKGTVSDLEIGYETFIVDDLNVPAKKLKAPYMMSLDKQLALGRCGAASFSNVRTTGAAKYATLGNVISTSDPKYVIVSTENLSIRNDLVSKNGIDWADANDTLEKHLSEHPEDFGKVQILSIHEVVSLA